MSIMRIQRQNYKITLISALALTLLSQAVAYAAPVDNLKVASETEVINTLEKETAKFLDVQGHWAQKSIEKWSLAGIIKGVGDNQFNPDGAMTRKDLAVLVDKILGLDRISATIAEDMGGSSYYKASLDRLVKEGIMTSERPDDKVTRQEAAIIICKAFGLDPVYKEEITGFSDRDRIAFWAKPYVAAVKEAGLMTGTPERLFMPQNSLTRAEMVTILNKAASNIEQSGQIYDKINQAETTYIGSVGETKIIKSKLGSTISTSDISIDNSIIKKLVQRNGKISIGIEGHVDLLKIYNTEINMLGGTITNLVVNGTNNVIKEEAVSIGRMTMKPGAAIKIPNGQIIKNNNDTDIVFMSSEIKTYTARDKQDLRLQLSPDNELEITSILGNSNKAMIRRNGIVPGNNAATEFISIPAKIKIEPGQIVVVRACDTGTDSNGLSVVSNLGEPLAIKAYNYHDIMGISKTEVITESNPYYEEVDMYDNKEVAEELGNGAIKSVNKKIRLNLYGQNIPNIDKLEILSASDKIDTGVYRATEAKLVSDKENITEADKIYEATVVFNAGENGMISMDRFYGYRITDNDGRESVVYPKIEDKSIPSNQVKSIVTGDATISNGIMTISDNRMTIETGVLFETGIAYKIVDIDEYAEGSNLPTVVDSTWDIKKGNGKGSDIKVELLDKAKDAVVYYAFYTKTDAGYTYGEIKDVVGEAAPVLSGSITKKTSATGKYATLNIGVITSSDIDLDKSKVVELVNKGTKEKELRNTSLRDISGKYNRGNVSFMLDDLMKGKEYSLVLDLVNSHGTLSNIEITFNAGA